jgi:hypothetical protein
MSQSLYTVRRFFCPCAKKSVLRRFHQLRKAKDVIVPMYNYAFSSMCIYDDVDYRHMECEKNTKIIGLDMFISNIHKEHYLFSTIFLLCNNDITLFG